MAIELNICGINLQISGTATSLTANSHPRTISNDESVRVNFHVSGTAAAKKIDTPTRYPRPRAAIGGKTTHFHSLGLNIDLTTRTSTKRIGRNRSTISQNQLRCYQR